ncbi:hypothetical protein COT97_01950 [Candidatus Falkowbacteria bacterium CG10_big_fil_rev_8_21_14_0_10_39_11]|uniref:Uncharacterized protein n=1 Tax=Candidatus Falkowbacteria bacterium CG10_big_fil_rev_8_21_14_0_10_39_11 TaxID=1974565 RepID=A0A2H0V5I3_9BACT|nr:MAG: hypothetical protein COT97_01950 [Candidatus Falkowbacteria bacterium CG10_big_fil_rev_8_21_14_0_10_39_11]
MNRNEMQQMTERVSGYKFKDSERQRESEILLIGLNSMVKKNTFDQIWDDAGLLESFKQKLDAIMDLIELEKEAHKDFVHFINLNGVGQVYRGTEEHMDGMRALGGNPQIIDSSLIENGKLDPKKIGITTEDIPFDVVAAPEHWIEEGK